MFAASKTDSASVSGGYQISRSLRFNSADSAYLNRTPASAGNRRTWTFSAWVKRSQLSSGNAMLATVSGSAFNYFSFGTSSGDWLTFAYFDGASDVFGVNTSGTSVFRDVSAWYHIVLFVDTTQATAANRVKIYVNNVEQTLGGTYPTQNYDTPINNTISNLIGGATGSYTAYLSDQYMTEVNFIDGQALTPSSFGETNAQTGVWQPKAYSGSYGTNGFYLNFSDNSNTTAATLGKDYSGNGNNWTPNNFSVTAGAGNDSLVDSPTSYGTDTGVGGTVRGNYATLNPLSKGATATLSNGNLEFFNTAPVGALVLSTIGMSSGKWYCEFTALGNDCMVGIFSQSMASGSYVGENSFGYGYYRDGGKYNVSSAAYGSGYTTNDIIGIALDMDAGTIVFYKNNVSQGIAFSSLSGTFYFASGNGSNTSLGAFNFGQRPFAYTAPSGFKALCTQNLPTPTIGATTATQAGKFFNPVTYTGTGSSLGVTGVGFQPDWVWLKNRSAGNNHQLFDAVRGVQKAIYSDLTLAESTNANALTAFGSDGFTLGSESGINGSGSSYVSWNWKANGSGSTNTAGSITSTVSANTTSGFSVVTYTGSGVAGTIGHGLGVTPSMIIVKSRSAAGDWPVYHSSLGNNKNIILNGTGGSVTSSTIWNSTSPTSSVFSVGINTDSNTVTRTYVAYCFAEVAGYSSIGSYAGNGSADGPFIFTGHRPAFMIVKRGDTTSGGYWRIYDSARNTSNVVDKELYPNDSSAEGTFTSLDFTSNGIKIRSSDSQFNQSGVAYIYMAFASNPFKYSLAR
jgi:hypothetical protein